jgi:predicted O-linked N-acetylglucosamine transferase (SPINDLY family)
MTNDINILIERAHNNLQNKKEDKAIDLLNQVLLIDPLNFKANHMLGVALGMKGQPMLAKEFLQKATAIEPNNFFAQFNCAKSLVDSGNDKEAIFYNENAVKIDPSNKEGWMSYGFTLKNLKFYSKSLECYNRALNIDPNYLEALVNISDVLILENKYLEALAILDRALLITSSTNNILNNKFEALIWLNRGVAFSKLFLKKEDALFCYNQAINIDSDCHLAYYNKSELLMAMDLHEEALLSIKKIINSHQEKNFILGDYIKAKMCLCDWSSLNEDMAKLINEVKDNKLPVHPWMLLGFVDDPDSQLILTKNYIQHNYPSNIIKGSVLKIRNKKIRLAYYSTDFKMHAVAFLLTQMLEEHDKDSFEIFAFSFCPHLERDRYQKRIINSVDKFIFSENLSDLEIVNLSKELNIDIAIDLNGHTGSSRTGIFENRVAPIQINYLGYPSTMGSSFIDYIIADPIIISDKNKPFFTEKIVFLPHTYQCNDNKKIIEKKKSRLEFGLKEDQFVFCSFNNSYKITPKIFNAWMEILSKTENSVMWILVDNTLSSKNLQLEAEKNGVSRDRLIFSERVDISAHLSRLPLADLFLDTSPYNAHTTASDALFMNLPVLTLIGESFQARVCASLLTAIGIPELITHSLEQYKNVAIELANNGQKIIELKAKLKNNISIMPLFNTKLYTQNLEKAYKKMYEDYCAGLKPRDIYIN